MSKRASLSGQGEGRLEGAKRGREDGDCQPVSLGGRDGGREGRRDGGFYV